MPSLPPKETPLNSRIFWQKQEVLNETTESCNLQP